jgi:hypothetical protein
MKYRFINYDQDQKIVQIRLADSVDNLDNGPVIPVSIARLESVEELEMLVAKTYHAMRNPVEIGEYSLELEQHIQNLVANVDHVTTAGANWHTIRTQMASIGMTDVVDYDGVPLGTTGPDLEII